MSKLKKGENLICVPCGRQVIISESGVSTTTVWCCGAPMKKGKGTAKPTPTFQKTPLKKGWWTQKTKGSSARKSASKKTSKKYSSKKSSATQGEKKRSPRKKSV